MSATPGPTEAGAPRVALVTAEVAHAFDVDLGPLLDALAAHGAQAVAADWHDDAVDWSAFDLVLVRSPWDYPERLADFLVWLDGVDGRAPLHNPAGVVRWNLDKRYLVALAGLGVPVVSTAFATSAAEAAAAIERVDLFSIDDQLRSEEIRCSRCGAHRRAPECKGSRRSY